MLALVCSRQVGKSTTGVQALTDAIFRYKKFKNPHFLVVMSTAEQAKNVYLKRLEDMFEGLPPSHFSIQGSTSSGHIMVTLKRPWLGDRVVIELAGSGNLTSLKGRTIHLMLLDEIAFFNDPECWTEIFSPMLDTTGGKALITSTVNGQNHFYDICMAFEDLEKQGYKSKLFREYTIRTCKARNEPWIKSKEAEYTALKQAHIFAQEYNNDWNAATLEEAPFMSLVGEKRRQGAIYNIRLPNSNLLLPDNTVNVAMDMGKPANNPLFVWVKKPNNGVHIIGYGNDFDSQYDLIDKLVNQYKGSNINIIYPHDAMHPSINDGKTRIELIQEYIRNRGYARYITTRVLSKTLNKKALLQDGVQCFKDATFQLDEPSVQKGLDILSKTRLKKDKKTKYVDYGNYIKNGSQHVADAFCHLAAALTNKFILTCPSTMAYPKYASGGLTYEGFKRRRNGGFKPLVHETT